MLRYSERLKARAAQRCRPMQKRNQRGAVAIEFAVLFIVFFVTLYAIIAYSLPLLLTLTFKQLSAEAGRAAIKADPAQSELNYRTTIGKEISRIIDESWLAKIGVSGCPQPEGWLSLGNSSYGYLAKDSNDRYVLYVCLQREDLIIPAIDLLGIQIPDLPKENGKVIIRSHTTVRLN